MRNRPTNLAVATSLLLCTATALLCVRSLFITDVIKLYRGERYWSVSTDPGTLAFARREFTFEWPGEGDSGFRYYARWYDVRYSHGRSERIHYTRTWDLSWVIGYSAHDQHDVIVGLPLWPALAAFAYLPVRTAIRRRRAQWRSKRKFCRACGYDLRVTPDRCPECGAVSSSGDSPLSRRGRGEDGGFKSV